MCCRFRVLDECDEMLNMGFVEDVEKILTAGGDIKTQTLLFSATLPGVGQGHHAALPGAHPQACRPGRLGQDEGGRRRVSIEACTWLTPTRGQAS